jgi:hypothetical protein
MNFKITLGIIVAATLITGVALANNNANISMNDMHQAHHQGNGMTGMMSMMDNANMTAMHAQCESSMGEQAHQQCESIMNSGACPMMQ